MFKNNRENQSHKKRLRFAAHLFSAGDSNGDFKSSYNNEAGQDDEYYYQSFQGRKYENTPSYENAPRRMISSLDQKVSSNKTKIAFRYKDKA